MELIQKIKNNLQLILITLVCFTVCFANYTPNTWLIGWDNLMPELNIWMNIKRSLFATWQEYQGLGLVGGMGHATDLIRQLIILPFVLVLPHDLIRYLWHFAMIFLGPISLFLCLKKLRINPWTSLASSLFYLLNFGSIQYFWVPLETFSTFWGFFPLLIFSFVNILRHPNKKNLLKLTLINLLAIPSFYVQTIFFVYIICLSVITFSHFLLNRNFDSIKKYFKIFSIILIINSFWILPFSYFLKNNIHNTTSGIGNYMATEDTLNRNQNRGYLGDLLLLRGYYYDFPSNDSTLMSPWVNYFSNQYSLVFGYIVSLFAVIGLIYIIIKKNKNFLEISLIGLISVSIIVFLSSTFPFNFVNQLFRSIPIIDQALRSPFTKFIVPAIFSFSILIIYGINCLSRIFTSLKYSQKINFFVIHFIFLLSLIIFIFPVFQGNYISPSMRKSIPKEYFETINFFKTVSPQSRIANLPQGSFWGWTNYKFKVNGSGFIWYGIEQPILDRAFDVWNLKNEQYYWEINHAIQLKDTEKLDNVLSKYSVEYILYDKNVYFPDDKIYSKSNLSTQELIENNPNIKLIKQFEKIYIYQYLNSTKPFLLNNIPSSNIFKFNNNDQIYETIGDYSSTNNPQISYKYPSLFTSRLQSELDFKTEIGQDIISISRQDNKVSFQKDDQYNSIVNISPLKNPNQIAIYKESGKYFHLENKENSNLFVFNFPNAPLSMSFLVKVDYRHISGNPLEISSISENNQNLYIKTHLDKKSEWTSAYFIIPALQSDNFDTGLNILFNNYSLNKNRTINDIKNVQIYPFPFDEISSLHSGNIPTQNNSRSYVSSNSNIFYHIVNTKINTSKYIILPQTFDNGWIAFAKTNNNTLLLKNHLLINNWSNGWEIPSNIQGHKTTFFFIFWPQILEFLGLLFLPILFTLIIKSKKN